VGWEHSNCTHFRDIALGGWEVVAKKKRRKLEEEKKRSKSQK